MMSVKASTTDITVCYLKNKSLRKTAAELNLSVSTVRRRLDGGVVGPVGIDRTKKKPLPWKRNHNTAAWLWFKNHRNETLPHSVDELVRLSGLKRYQVNYFLCRRKTEAVKYVEALPKFNEVDVFIEGDFGKKIASRAVTSYVFDVDKFDLSVTLKVLVAGQHYLTASMPWSVYVDLLKNSPLLKTAKISS